MCRKWLLRLGLFFMYSCWTGVVPAQGLDFESVGKGTLWGQHTFNDILQDQQGFIWLATWTGLVRFDGQSGDTYTQAPGDLRGLQDNKFTCLYEDSKGRIWAGALFSGFYQYIREADTFRHYQHDPVNPNSLSSNKVWAILEDDYGHLWIGTENGLNQFDPETGNFRHIGKTNNARKGLTHEFVYS
ncbi:MAG: two-component regulator propeller domain-containing protein, partial [Bacteroidota bacterium]